MSALLQTHALCRHFGGLHAVRDVSLNVGQRTIHSILGPNGAGKTTLFNLITGAIPPASGTVLFDDSDVTGWTPERLARRGIVRTFQRTSVFLELSLCENVALAIRSHRGLNYSVRLSRATDAAVREEAHQCLRSVGLAEKAGLRAKALAHGSQRALDVAIGLALKPRLILMDEPLAGMSKGDRHGIGELIVKLRDELGLTVVLVEHDVGMVMSLSDVITVMQNGKVIAEGPPCVIRDSAAVKSAYLHGSFAS
ncbi:ABC transporter ATP-binding protein [Paraburkholderia susongensis]|uniref:Amino acid/amide ABC transporter ATP-binding protein 1, HAAT family n=1 Tax=Paraburkholderia susongensis TaxID=1515439 RepID=A0A1X7KLG7_9BURK|nr:ABC transporter ATP-binding protein [Paraburkholderia susongensis]SMG41961.1 amino acid/amide ABC transporter ATP-binding protein 1, HAAT family [Paraburkholderia susongensis]